MVDQFISLDDALGLKREQTCEMYRHHINPGLANMLSEMGLDKSYIKAEGTVLWDAEGKEYLDFTNGFGALTLGHNPPGILEAIAKVTVTKMPVLQTLSKLTAAFAHNLAQISPGELKSFIFCNSPFEAVTAALKVARAATQRHRLLYCGDTMHAKPMDDLSVSEADPYSRFFEPLARDRQKVPYGDTIALETALQDEQAACFIVEPILVEGGVLIAGEEYLQKVREICTRYGTLLIVDEAQTGLGRCGSIFTCFEEDVIPDIICLPFLGGGLLPISGVITTSDIWQKAYGSSGKCQLHSSSSNNGNTLALAAAITVLNETISLDLSRQAREKGAYLLQKLTTLANESNQIKEVRGKGLLIGVELEKFADTASEKGDKFLSSPVLENLLSRHDIISNCTCNNPSVLLVTPPLTATYEQLDKFVDALSSTLAEIPGSTLEYAATLSRTVEPAFAPVLVVAHDDAFPPWMYLQEGSSMGISVDVFKELARQNNIMIKFIGATWSSIFPLLTNKQVDLILNAGWPNTYFDDFPVIASDPYAQFESHLFMKRDPSDPRVAFNLEDLAGKRIGVPRAGMVASLLKKTGAEVIEYENDTLSFLDHFWNKTDFVAAEKMVGLTLNLTSFQGCFQIVSEPIHIQEVVCLAHKDHAMLIERINAEIASLKKSQFIDQIYERYNQSSGPRKLESRIRMARNE